MKTTVMPLDTHDSIRARKARVAELHDLWCKANFNPSVMLLLLKQRY
jgi:hypothetical protein